MAVLSVFFGISAFGGPKRAMTLDEAIAAARESSVAALEARSSFVSSY